MSKVLDSINENYAGKILAETINISSRPELASEYKVRYVPHLLFVDAKGEVFQQKVGFMQEADVIDVFDKAGIIVK